MKTDKKFGCCAAAVFGAISATLFVSVPASADAGTAARTYIAVFGQLYKTSPSLTGVTRAYQHPGSFGIEANPDTAITFTRLRWQHWGSRKSIAHGFARTCSEGGAEGPVCHTGQVRLVVDRFAPCSDGNFYERLRAYGIPEYPSVVDIPVGSEACGVKD